MFNDTTFQYVIKSQFHALAYQTHFKPNDVFTQQIPLLVGSSQTQLANLMA